MTEKDSLSGKFSAEGLSKCPKTVLCYDLFCLKGLVPGKEFLMLDTNSLYVTDEDGNEKRMVILFTFDSDDYGKQYVVFQDPDGDESEIYASAYTDDGELTPIDTDEEWDMVQEVINTFASDEDEADE